MFSKVLLSFCLGFLTIVQSVHNSHNFYNNNISRIRRESKDLPLTLSSCGLPQHPDFGQWSIQDPLAPGQFVENGTVLRVGCNKDYVLDGSSEVVYEDGKWSGIIGHCTKTCSPRTSTETLKVTCIYQNKETENCAEAVDGILAKFKCAPLFENVGLEQSPVHLCQNGTWNQTLPRCIPVCGGSSNVGRRIYPWHAALYEKFSNMLICGGSLISQRIILTVAQCVTDNSGNLFPRDDYLVAVRKHRRSVDDSRDRHAQFSDLEAMFVSDLYKGKIQSYFADIATLVATKTFTLSRRVQPVCLDRSHALHLLPSEYGYVVGWGYTREDSTPAEVLKELKVPIADATHCKENLPTEFLRHLTFDKFCAGYLNRGISVCKGDSGGGLVFGRDGRFYITGMVSTGSPSIYGGCDSNQYSLYTNVSQYIDHFILQKLSQYEP